MSLENIWDGKGKVPVGSVCLGKRFGRGSFEECKIVHLDGDRILALFKMSRQEGALFVDPSWCEFVNRIRTPEDDFISCAKLCTENTLLDRDDPKVLAFITNLIEAGFTAPDDKL